MGTSVALQQFANHHINPHVTVRGVTPRINAWVRTQAAGVKNHGGSVEFTITFAVPRLPTTTSPAIEFDPTSHRRPGIVSICLGLRRYFVYARVKVNRC